MRIYYKCLLQTQQYHASYLGGIYGFYRYT
jgi:hypothetical protein